MPNTLGGWGGLYDAVADVGITAGRPEHKVVVILGTDPVEPPTVEALVVLRQMMTPTAES